jgi:gliding motility-associated-like protein
MRFRYPSSISSTNSKSRTNIVDLLNYLYLNLKLYNADMNIEIVKSLIWILFFLNVSPVLAQRFIWAKAFPSGEHYSESTDIALGKNDDAFFCGAFTGEIKLSNQTTLFTKNNDGFIIKLDSIGSFLWGKKMGSKDGMFVSIEVNSKQEIYACGILYDSLILPNDTIVGEPLGTSILEKYNNNGDLLWIKTFPLRNFRKIVLDYEDNIYTISNDFNATTTGFNTRLTKFDGEGNQIYNQLISQHISSTYHYSGVTLTIDLSKNVYISGEAGKEALIGTIPFQTDSRFGAFMLVKCNDQGVPIWIQKIEDIPFDGAAYEPELKCDSIGNIYVNTYRHQLLLTKCNSAGNILWQNKREDIDITLSEIMINEKGNLVVAGEYKGEFILDKVPFQGGNNVFIGMFSSDGQMLWTMNEKNGNSDVIYSAARSNLTGKIYASGVLQALEPAFGDILLPDLSGGKRAFVIKANVKKTASKLNLGEDADICNGQSITLNVKGFAQQQWQDGSTENNFTITTPGKYYVTVLDVSGEILSDTINVLDCFVKNIPNVITPNGDDANEYFQIQKLDTTRANALLIIDRWGKKIYSSQKYQNNWNAHDVGSGVYYYQLHNATNGHVYKGWIHVIKAGDL